MTVFEIMGAIFGTRRPSCDTGIDIRDRRKQCHQPELTRRLIASAIATEQRNC